MDVEQPGQAASARRPRVSVVVPTYRSGDGLDRVVAALDALTLGPGELEAVFVDDGSPDDTHARLLAIAADRPWVVVERIENSGWPSRPRNVGTRLARGEYVLFMDHDDHLYPDGLRRALELAEPARADVINAKETRSRGLAWGWDTWLDDVVVGRDDLRPQHLMPMTPHKLYRTEFLRENGIEFREGGRVMWEDIHFNLEVYARARSVAVFSSAPVYQWMLHTGTNSSSAFDHDADVWWDALESVLDTVASVGLDPDDERWFLRHQYTGRVLAGMLGPSLAGRPEEYREASRARGLRLARERVPLDLDATLPPVSAARSQLLRASDFATLQGLGSLDSGTDVLPTATSVAWDGRALAVEVRAPWVHRDEAPLPFARRAGHLVRVLPGVDVHLDDAGLLVDDALAEADGTLGARERTSRASWALASTSVAGTEPLEGTGHEQVVVTVSGRVPLDATGVMPGALAGTWDVTVRAGFMGARSHRAVGYDGPPVVALVDGALAVAYASRAGRLVLDTGERVRSLAGALRVAPARADVSRGPSGGVRVVLPLPEVHVVGSTRRGLEVVCVPAGGHPDADGPASPGVLVADDDGARVEADLDLGPGAHDLVLRVDGRTRRTRVRVHVRRLRGPRTSVVP